FCTTIFRFLFIFFIGSVSIFFTGTFFIFPTSSVSFFFGVWIWFWLVWLVWLAWLFRIFWNFWLFGRVCNRYFSSGWFRNNSLVSVFFSLHNRCHRSNN